MLRVVVEHTPQLFAILGLHDETACEPTLTLLDADGRPHTYYRTRSTPRWVLYRAAVSSIGAGQPGDPQPAFSPDQR